jgi:hypothetical protein
MRDDLERVAIAVATGAQVFNRRQQLVADSLRDIVAERRAAAGNPLSRMARGRGRQAERAWLRLKASESADTVRTLIERATDRRGQS